jgi:hypothetical protein
VKPLHSEEVLRLIFWLLLEVEQGAVMEVVVAAAVLVDTEHLSEPLAAGHLLNRLVRCFLEQPIQ